MMPPPASAASLIAAWIVRARGAISAALLLLMLALAAGIPRLGFDVAFDKTLPLQHPYMEVLRAYGAQFGSRDEVLVALAARQGDIYTPEFLTRLERLTSDVFYIHGVDRGRVTSLFTPNVRFTEIAAGGFVGGPVLPDGFTPTPAMIEQLRANIRKSEQARRLVSGDGSAALVRAGLASADPASGSALDYLRVAAQLEQQIRARYSDAQTQVYIIGFAPFIGEMTAALSNVAGLLALTVLATWLILYGVLRSVYAASLPVICSLLAVGGLLGALGWLGMGVNPTGVLVPFLIVAIGVSHGVQIANAWLHAIALAADARAAAAMALGRMLLPGVLAMAIDLLGFATLLWIDIPLVRELGMIATGGVFLLLLCNLVLLPCLLAVVPTTRVPRGTVGLQMGRRFTL